MGRGGGGGEGSCRYATNCGRERERGTSGGVSGVFITSDTVTHTSNGTVEHKEVTVCPVLVVFFSYFKLLSFQEIFAMPGEMSLREE